MEIPVRSVAQTFTLALATCEEEGLRGSKAAARLIRGSGRLVLDHAVPFKVWIGFSRARDAYNRTVFEFKKGNAHVHFRLRNAVWVLLGASFLFGVSLSAHAQPDARVVQEVKRQQPIPCASTADAIPRGLAVVLPTGDTRDQAVNQQALNNSFMSGVAVQINWRDIEPAEGRFDWSRLDALFAAAESSNKWLRLSIFPGFFSPEWALQGAKTDVFEIQYGPGHGTPTKLPMPWDRVYLDRWLAFVRKVAERYGNSGAFRVIGAAGPTSVSDEMTLPVSQPAIQKWLSAGYTPAKYLGAWEEVFRVYAESFPNQCVSLSGPDLPILENGRFNRPERMRAKQDVVERAMRVFGRRLAIQSNDLHAGHAPVEAVDNTDFINSYSGRIITGFEMRGGSQGPIASQIMGAEGNPPLALRRSIDKGMAPNTVGRHVNYLEIYEGDVLSPEMQPVLKYAASLFR